MQTTQWRNKTIDVSGNGGFEMDVEEPVWFSDRLDVVVLTLKMPGQTSNTYIDPATLESRITLQIQPALIPYEEAVSPWRPLHTRMVDPRHQRTPVNVQAKARS